MKKILLLFFIAVNSILIAQDQEFVLYQDTTTAADTLEFVVAKTFSNPRGVLTFAVVTKDTLSGAAIPDSTCFNVYARYYPSQEWEQLSTCDVVDPVPYDGTRGNDVAANGIETYTVPSTIARQYMIVLFREDIAGSFEFEITAKYIE